MGGWSFGIGIGGRWDYTGDKGLQVNGSVAATGGYDGKNGGVGFDFSAGRGSRGSVDFGICTNDAATSLPAVTTYGELLDQLGLGKAGTAGATTGAAGGVATTYTEDDLGEDEDAISEYEAGGGSTSGSTSTDETNDTDDTDDADDTDDDVDLEDDGVGGGGGGDGIDGGGGEGSSDDGEGDDGCGGGGLAHLGGKHGSGGGGSSGTSSGTSGGGGVHGGDGEDDRCGTGGQLDVGTLAHSHGSHGSGHSDGTGRPHVGPDDYFPDPEGNDPGNPITRGALGLAHGGLDALEVGSLRSLRVG